MLGGGCTFPTHPFSSSTQEHLFIQIYLVWRGTGGYRGVVFPSDGPRLVGTTKLGVHSRKQGVGVSRKRYVDFRTILIFWWIWNITRWVGGLVVALPSSVSFWRGFWGGAFSLRDGTGKFSHPPPPLPSRILSPPVSVTPPSNNPPPPPDPIHQSEGGRDRPSSPTLEVPLRNCRPDP